MSLHQTKLIIKKLSAGLFRKDETSGDEVPVHSSCEPAVDVSIVDKGAEPPSLQQLSTQHEPAENLQQALPPVATKAASTSLKSTPGSAAGKSSFFFARVPPTITQDQLLELFSKFGEVEDLNLFRPFAEAKTSKGCGIVRFLTPTAAAVAKAALHGKYKWAEDASPMVVEWVNEDKMRSACQKPGSNEIIFEPKSKTKAAKQRGTRLLQQQQQQQDGATQHSSPSNVMAHSSAAASLCDVNMSWDQAMTQQMALGPGHAGMPQRSLQEQQQQQLLQHQLHPPPPLLLPTDRSFAQQQPHLGLNACAETARPLLALNSSHQQQQFGAVFTPVPSLNGTSQGMCTSLPGQHAYLPAFRAQAAGVAGTSAAAAVHLSNSSLDTLLQQQQSSVGSSVGCGHAADHAVGFRQGMNSVVPLPGGYSLLDTSKLPAFQQKQQADVLTASNASNLSAAHAASAANSMSAVDHSSTLLLIQNGVPVQQQQRYVPSSLAPAAAATGTGNSSGATSGVAVMCNQAAFGGAASAAAAHGVLDADSAGMFGHMQLLSEGCNAQSIGGISAHMSGRGVHNPNQLHLQLQLQQQLPLQPDDESWTAGCGVGYFDMPGSSSSNQNALVSGGNIAVQGVSLPAAANTGSFATPCNTQHLQVGLENNTAGAVAAMQHSMQQLRIGGDMGPRGLCTASDPSMMGGLQISGAGGAVSQGARSISCLGPMQQQLQGQLLQQQQHDTGSNGPLQTVLPVTSCPVATTFVGGSRISAATAGLGMLNIDGSNTDGLASNLQCGIANAASAGSNRNEVVTLPIAKGSSAVQVLGQHLGSVSEISGAELQIRADSGDLIVWVRGTARQANMAQQLVAMLLQPQQS